MKPERPVVVLVFGILNIVFGGMGIIAMLCLGIFGAFMGLILSSAPPSANLPRFPSDLLVLFAIVLVYSLIMAVILTISGIGLINMTPWARRACIAYSVLTIGSSIVSTVIAITYVYPTMQKWQKDLQEEVQEQQRQGARTSVTNQSNQSRWLNTIFSVVGGIMHVAYAIALLIVMFIPSVTAAFAGRHIRERIDWDREPDDQWNEESKG